jgi:hypothetical protein
MAYSRVNFTFIIIIIIIIIIIFNVFIVLLVSDCRMLLGYTLETLWNMAVLAGFEEKSLNLPAWTKALNLPAWTE